MKNVRYRLHGPSRKKLEQAENVVQKFVASPRGRLEIAIHEASHKLAADELGLTAFYSGPTIEQDGNDFGVTLGGVRLLSSETDKLTTKELARLLVSGRVGEMVLLQSDQDSFWSEDDFRSFVFSGRDTPSELILVYKQTEEEMSRELAASLKRQRSIIYESQRFEQSIWPELAVQKVSQPVQG